MTDCGCDHGATTPGDFTEAEKAGRRAEWFELYGDRVTHAGRCKSGRHEMTPENQFWIYFEAGAIPRCVACRGDQWGAKPQI